MDNHCTYNVECMEALRGPSPGLRRGVGGDGYVGAGSLKKKGGREREGKVTEPDRTFCAIVAYSKFYVKFRPSSLRTTLWFITNEV